MYTVSGYYECIAFECLSISSFLSIFLEMFLLSMLMMTKRYYYSYGVDKHFFAKLFGCSGCWCAYGVAKNVCIEFFCPMFEKQDRRNLMIQADNSDR